MPSPDDQPLIPAPEGNPKRSAADIIAAFKYQIWLTILRWIKAAPHEDIYIETAEDFDVVTSDQVDANQVKYTTASLSLNTAAAMKALSDFWDLRKRNPTRSLVFRYITTGDAAKELNSTFTRGRNGLEVWEGAKTDNADLEEIRAYLLRKATQLEPGESCPLPDRSQAVFPRATVATRDQLQEWEELDSAAMMDVLKGYFDTFIARMTKNQVNVVKAIIHPEIFLGLDFTSTAPSEEPIVKILDSKQEELARDIGAGHRLVFGVAGSGKTVLLIARAKLIARLNPQARVLVLCYNVSFGAYLADALEDFKTVMVMTFHSWGVRNGAKWTDGDDAKLGENLLAKLQTGSLDSKRYDTILIDEAQDFDPTWYGCVLAAMKDPINGELLIVGDGGQGLYKRTKVSWKQLGIQAAGRTQYLHANYRNTRPIISLATRFANKSGDSSEDGVSAPSVDPDKCIRLAGLETVLLTKKTKQDEVDRAVRVVGDLLDGRWFGETIPPLKPDQIGILYRANHGLINVLRNRLKASKQDCPVVWLTEKGKNAKGRIGEAGVKILTMHSSKGLQFKAVILLFAGDCPADFPGTTEEEERSLFYVALTRAEDYLAISSSSDSTFIREIQAAGA